MEISLTGAYTVPPYHFDLPIEFLRLLSSNIKEYILQKYPLPKAKSEELEIYICTDGTDAPSSVRKISKTDRGKYLTFHFWISYQKVVREISPSLLVDIDFVVFTKEFMFCLQEALKNYGILENVFDETEKMIIENIEENPEKYKFPFTEQESSRRLRMREALDRFEQSKIPHDRKNSHV